MRKLTAFLCLVLLFSTPVIAQENKVSVKKSGDAYLLEANGKNFFNNNTAFTKFLVYNSFIINPFLLLDKVMPGCFFEIL